MLKLLNQLIATVWARTPWEMISMLAGARTLATWHLLINQYWYWAQGIPGKYLLGNSMTLSDLDERRDRIEYESMCSCICALSIHIYIYIYIYIYICVCVWNFWTEVKPLLLLLFQLSDGGPWALGWHGPTKTHPSCCANVPAIVESWWDVTNPRTTMPFFNENHFRIWIRHMNGWRWLLIYLSAPLVQSETAVNFLSIPFFAYIVGFFVASFDFILFFKVATKEFSFHSTPNPPVRCQEWSEVFARQMHSTSKFDKTSLSKCVCACACVHV